jgi:uncharacterized membrane protein YgdD (TMEM256/DUF423 family)
MIRFSKFTVAMLAYAGIAGASDVAFSVLPAHGLDKMAPTGERAIGLFGYATTFQMNHTLALMLITIVAEFASAGCGKMVLRVAASLMALAVLLFPSALYSKAFGGPAWWAPYGGTASMIAWIAFAVGCILCRARSVENANGGGAS